MIGEIRIFAGNFAPKNWAFCNGQMLSIAQNQALYSILGTTYGGDGTFTFALPDLRGRVPVACWFRTWFVHSKRRAKIRIRNQFI